MEKRQKMLKSCLVIILLLPSLSGRPSMFYILSISLVGNKAHPLSKTLGARSALGSRAFHILENVHLCMRYFGMEPESHSTSLIHTA